MESALLKAFHDGGEHFDGGYQSFDGNNIWENDRDTMHLNLTHTLDGILPASPSTMIMDYDTPYLLENNEIKLECDSEDEIQTRKLSVSSTESDDLIYGVPAVEIIPIDPNCEYSSPMRSNDEDDNNEDDDNDDDEDDDDDDDDEDDEYDEYYDNNKYEANYSNISSLNKRKVRSNSDSSNQSFEELIQLNNKLSYMTENDCDKIFINNNTVSNSVVEDDKIKLFLDSGNINKKLMNKTKINTKSVSLPISPKRNSNHINDLNSMTFEDLDFDLNSISYLSPSKINTEFIITTPDKNSNKIGNSINFMNGDDYKLEESDIDVKNFDLTTYITEEDCKLPPSTPGRNLNICLDRYEVSPVIQNNNNNFVKTKRSVKEISKLKLLKSPAIKFENIKRGYKKLHNETEESDSDVSIDVETVSEPNYGWKSGKKEAIKIEPDTTTFPIEDDDNRDPTWSPQINTIKPQRTTTQRIASTAAPATINKKKCPTLTQPQSTTKPKIRMKILNAGAQLSRNKLKSSVILQNSDNNRIQKDHDYCSPTKKQIPLVKSTPPRRAIEIPTAYSILERRQHRLGLGRGKNISMCSKPPPDNIDIKESKHDIDKHWKYKQFDSKISTQIKNENEQNILTQVKIEKIEINDEKPIENKIIKIEEVPIKKRKLNLQEYKMRRENNIEQNGTNEKSTKIVEKLLTNEIVKSNPSKSTSNKILQINKLDDQVLLNQMKNDKNYKKLNEKDNIGFDPIREATKKALRMQYLKKTNRNKITEPQLVPCNSIMPLLPLAELTSNKNDPIIENIKKIDNKKLIVTSYVDYDEIIIISIGCNTVISISPKTIIQINQNNDNSKLLTTGTTGIATSDIKTKIQMDDILSRSTLLSNINDTINKAKSSGGNINITSNSLLSSITNVVLKKTTTNFITGLPLIQVSPNIGVSPPNIISPGKPEKSRTNILNNNITNLNNETINKIDNDNNLLEHGEDKIIMHLKKDRIRPISYTISTQTESLIQFPLLKRLERKYNNDDVKNHTSSNFRTSSCSSIESENYKRNQKYNNSLLRRSRKSPSPKRKRHDQQQQYSLLRSNNYNRKSNSPKHRSRSPLNNFSLQNCYSTSTSSSQRSKRRSRSISKDNKKPYYRTQSRGSSISHSSTSSDISRTRNRNRNWNQRRYSTSSSHSSSASSRSRSRGSSKSRQSTHPNSSFNMNNNVRERHASPEERRIVYVGRIERETSKEDLKSKFVSYGPIKQITIHHKETGLKYGFVTYERAQDAFTAIEVSGRDPKISMYDISFGGRRAFCRNLYSDLDGTGVNFSLSKSASQNQPPKSNVCDDSFEALLQKVKDKIGAKKSIIKT